MNRTILKNIKTAILHSSKTEKEVWEYLDLSQEQKFVDRKSVV